MMPFAPSSSQRTNTSRRNAQIKSYGRGAVTTPQALITVAARVPKNAHVHRRQEKNANNRASLYAWHSENPEDHNCYKGQLAMVHLNPKGSFSGAIANDAQLEIFTCVSGLSRSAEIGMPCVVAVTRNVLSPEANLTTIIAQGVQTIVNTGCQAIPPGAQVYADPNPFVIDDLTQPGKEKPGIAILGVPDTTMHIQTRPFDTSTISAMNANLCNTLRERFARPEVGADIGKALRGVDPGKNLCEVMRRMCDVLFLEKTLARDMPIVPLLRNFAVEFFLQMVKISHGTNDSPFRVTLSKEENASLRVYALQAKRLTLLESEEMFSRIYTKYDSSIEHDTLNGKPHSFSAAKNHSSLHSDHLRHLLTNKSLNDATPEQRSGMLMEADARLAFHYNRHHELLVCAEYNYIQKFMIGRSLCGAPKGGPLDILLGGH